VQSSVAQDHVDFIASRTRREVDELCARTVGTPASNWPHTGASDRSAWRDTSLSRSAGSNTGRRICGRNRSPAFFYLLPAAIHDTLIKWPLAQASRYSAKLGSPSWRPSSAKARKSFTNSSCDLPFESSKSDLPTTARRTVQDRFMPRRLDRPRGNGEMGRYVGILAAKSACQFGKTDRQCVRLDASQCLQQRFMIDG
jgi:hypothetical protein